MPAMKNEKNDTRPLTQAEIDAYVASHTSTVPAGELRKGDVVVTPDGPGRVRVVGPSSPSGPGVRAEITLLRSATPGASLIALLHPTDLVKLAGRDSNDKADALALLAHAVTAGTVTQEHADELRARPHPMDRTGPVSAARTTVGTCNFVSIQHARAYYSAQGVDSAGVDAKLAEGSIAIGVPAYKPGQLLGIIKGEGRFSLTY
jgi:hypothetical protein